MHLTSPVPRELLAASQCRTPHITIKMADTPEELHGVFRLNYQTYRYRTYTHVSRGYWRVLQECIQARHMDRAGSRDRAAVMT